MMVISKVLLDRNKEPEAVPEVVPEVASEDPEVEKEAASEVAVAAREVPEVVPEVAVEKEEKFKKVKLDQRESTDQEPKEEKDQKAKKAKKVPSEEEEEAPEDPEVEEAEADPPKELKVKKELLILKNTEPITPEELSTSKEREPRNGIHMTEDQALEEAEISLRVATVREMLAPLKTSSSLESHSLRVKSQRLSKLSPMLKRLRKLRRNQNQLLKKLKMKNSRVSLLFKNILLKRRLVTTRKKPESQKKTKRLVLNMLKDQTSRLEPRTTHSRTKSSTVFLDQKTLSFSVSKVEMMNTNSKREEKVEEAAEVAVVAEAAVEAEAAEAVPEVVLKLVLQEEVVKP